MYGVLEDGFKDNMTETEALKLAARSLHASGQRDAASGNGMDLAVITPKDGYVQVSQEQIKKLLS
jgi:20S proteasome alpha/beta subunit